MNTDQKDPIQFIAIENRHDQARKQPFVSMDADLEFAVKIQLLEQLKGRLHQDVYGVIEIVRGFAGRAPSK